MEKSLFQVTEIIPAWNNYPIPIGTILRLLKENPKTEPRDDHWQKFYYLEVAEPATGGEYPVIGTDVRIAGSVFEKNLRQL